MLRVIQSVLLSSAIVLLVIGASPAVGADMLYQTERPVVVQQRAAAVVAPASVAVRPVRCDEYYIEYRAPLYDPRVEIIRQCDRQIVRY
ncbi:hypothetical protein [Ciceribacter sp. L1K22]|uniref:hypothetical protein n=1 Tax=Ciceribacter sp. L1K22 TaxID=2820275 RepID=UPI001ABDFAEF|nr:hypothetical protein [Ciceribacter sp. L1K22]MBO3760555.1 hypothetical protein [Ciceribacter sp. L1K22]